jgi:quinol monooxygenase YgiN
MADTTLRVVADFHVPESLDIEEFIAALKSVLKVSANHEGVVQYDLLQNTEDSRAFTMFERWEFRVTSVQLCYRKSEPEFP